MKTFLCGMTLASHPRATPINQYKIRAASRQQAASLYHELEKPSHLWLVSVKEVK